MDDRPEDWHLDKNVTLGIIFALLLNAASSVWWASRLDYTVQDHEKRISSTELQIKTIAMQDGQNLERLARIESNQEYQLETLKEIKEVLKIEKRR
jgi:hypothetical protein